MGCQGRRPLHMASLDGHPPPTRPHERGTTHTHTHTRLMMCVGVAVARSAHSALYEPLQVPSTHDMRIFDRHYLTRPVALLQAQATHVRRTASNDRPALRLGPRTV